MIRIKNQSDFDNYTKLAKENPEAFWKEATKEFVWKKPWSKLQSGDFNDLDIKWFEDAELNITENCLDRHLKNNANKTAIIYEPNNPHEDPQQITYKQLHENVCKTANMFKDLGIKKGDVICFYMGMVPELLYGVLASARMGAIHSVVFGGFSSKALAERINDCQAKLLVTNDGSNRGNKTIALKQVANDALENTTCVKHLLVHKRTNEEFDKHELDQDWDKLFSKASSDFPAVTMKAEDPLFILYTSGSTGKPKGLMHTTAGYMTYAQYSFDNVFQMQDDSDVFWCTADIGWITGHTYFSYGPLLSGVTQVMFEGVPTWPDGGRFWEVVDKHKVSHFYTAPTAIRALEALDIELVNKHNLSSLKVLGSVGEPINEEAWQWYNKNIGKNNCPIVDTWWQTETGGIMISPLAHITEMKPCYAINPLPGIEPALVDTEGKILEANDVEGNLIIKKPWPGMARTVYGDPERYKSTYFSTYPGFYFTGDGAKRDEKGNYRIIGRVDDVINVSGHRIGTAEVENAINEHESVVESAVVGFPHEIKGQGIYAYVICTSEIKDKDKFKKQITDLVSDEIGRFAKPEKIQIVSGLPKTRSGKIMRRILRKVAEKQTDQLGDTSTLLNPEVVEEIIQGAQ
ncbi:MAG: acetate--CoA ligase [Bdellovibrionales bacterium]|nr:acetate--CoA ligase [Bdellovibrionales bacterium]